MIERRTVSQCISSDYCEGWNDAVDEISKVFDAETILALKAVIFGCNSNRNLCNASFTPNMHEPGKIKLIRFSKALEICDLLIQKIDSSANGGENK